MVLGGVVASMAFAGLAVDGDPAAAKGVHFDPDSPAGKEYALPLAEARKDASGDGGADDAPGATAPLFGIGIAKRGPVPIRENGTNGEPGGAPPGRDVPPEGASPRESTASGARFLAAGDGYSLTSFAALVAAIVLLGATLALALRGLQRWAVPGSNQ